MSSYSPLSPFFFSGFALEDLGGSFTGWDGRKKKGTTHPYVPRTPPPPSSPVQIRRSTRADAPCPAGCGGFLARPSPHQFSCWIEEEKRSPAGGETTRERERWKAPCKIVKNRKVKGASNTFAISSIESPLHALSVLARASCFCFQHLSVSLSLCLYATTSGYSHEKTQGPKVQTPIPARSSLKTHLPKTANPAPNTS